MGLVNTFTAKWFPEISFAMHLNKHIFRTQKLMKYLTYEASFFWEHGKFNVDFKNRKKTQQNIYGFSQELISIGKCKFSLLLREYS